MNNLTGPSISEFLNFLVEKKNEASLKSYISIRNAIDLFSIPFGTITISAGVPLFRCRIHEELNRPFTKVTELTHRQDLFNIKSFGRANEPLQSIFYCSTDRETALFEISQIQKANGTLKEEAITYGKWILKKDITVAHLPLIVDRIGKNPIADHLHFTFEELVKKYTTEDTKDWRSVIDLFSNEYSREGDGAETDYLISCAFSNYIYATPGINSETREKIIMDGIMYPSVKYSEVGMNLAILPQLIYDGTVILDSVIYQKMERVKEQTYLETETNIAHKIDYQNNKIIW